MGSAEERHCVAFRTAKTQTTQGLQWLPASRPWEYLQSSLQLLSSSQILGPQEPSTMASESQAALAEVCHTAAGSDFKSFSSNGSLSSDRTYSHPTLRLLTGWTPQFDNHYKHYTNIYAFHKYLSSAGPLTLTHHDADQLPALLSATLEELEEGAVTAHLRSPNLKPCSTWKQAVPWFELPRWQLTWLVPQQKLWKAVWEIFLLKNYLKCSFIDISSASLVGLRATGSPSPSSLWPLSHSYPSSSTQWPWQLFLMLGVIKKSNKRKKNYLSVFLSCWFIMQRQKQFYHFKWGHSAWLGGQSRGEHRTAVPHALTLLWKGILVAFSYQLIWFECGRFLSV